MLAALAALATASPAAAQSPPPWLKVQDGVTQPQFALADAIEQTVFVETPLDTDRDGRARPRPDPDQPAGGDRLAGHRCPGRLRAQPVPRRSRRRREPPGRRRRPAAGGGTSARRPPTRPRPAQPARLARRLLRPARLRRRARREHRHVRLGRLPDVGGPAETLGTKAVIDWLNGRAARLRRGRAAGPRRLDDGRRRHDRRLLQRHAGQPGRDHRRRGPEDDHPGLRDLAAGTTTTAPTGSSSPRTPTPAAPARTTTSARTPTCSATSSAARA